MARAHGAFHLQADAAVQNLPYAGAHIDELQHLGGEGKNLPVGFGTDKTSRIKIAEGHHTV